MDRLKKVNAYPSKRSEDALENEILVFGREVEELSTEFTVSLVVLRRKTNGSSI